MITTRNNIFFHGHVPYRSASDCLWKKMILFNLWICLCQFVINFQYRFVRIYFALFCSWHYLNICIYLSVACFILKIHSLSYGRNVGHITDQSNQYFQRDFMVFLLDYSADLFFFWVILGKLVFTLLFVCINCQYFNIEFWSSSSDSSWHMEYWSSSEVSLVLSLANLSR